jgi:hypothetical protein
MPGLTGRIVTYIKAKISRLLDRAEDPTETLDYAYERQLEDLQNVKEGDRGRRHREEAPAAAGGVAARAGREAGRSGARGLRVLACAK